MGNKKTGSFYTPEKLVQYMVDWAQSELDFDSVLEPAAGDGRFIRKLSGKNVTALEIISRKNRKIRKRFSEITSIKSDFILYCMSTSDRFDLVIGNPPYISKKQLSKKMRRRSAALTASFGLDESYFQNLWVSFILGALRLLNCNGAILYVLPFEFLQVQYAEKLRCFLEQKFDTIEIVTFEEKIFPGIEQGICLVFMRNTKTRHPIITYKTLDNLDELNVVFSSSIKRNKPLKKWANCLIDDGETDFLKNLCSTYNNISSFGDISPGIVTGANSYFIPSAENIGKYDLDKYCLPIVQKSQDVGNKILFTESDFKRIAVSGKNNNIINTNGIKTSEFSLGLKEYLSYGKEKEVHKGYKCSTRNRWHDVPLVKAGKVSFFKRYGNLPKIIVNESEIHTTDSAYNVRLLDEYDPYSFVFSFYNSLTLTMCEYNGRFYGGGVCELVPSEFKSLPLPYTVIEMGSMKKLDAMFRDNASIIDIISFVDDIVLDLPKEKVEMLQDIRNRYINRRLGIVA